MLKQIQSTTTLAAFAHFMGVKPSSLSYILYKKSASNKYFEFEIPKKSGGVRNILSPTPDLKMLQTKILHILEASLVDIKEINPQYGTCWHGFKKETSCLTGAWPHKNKKHVLNIDLSNFFDSINFGRVRGFFIKDKNFSLCPTVATIIAQIACYNNKLPQGSPCSPIIANLVGNIIDIKLVQLAKKYRCTYTRYADDITFSTNVNDFPAALAILNDDGTAIIGEPLQSTIESTGFYINQTKIRLQNNKSRQVVTGLVVNKRINTSEEYRKQVRSCVYSLTKTGEFTINKIPGSINQLHGMLAHINAVDRFRQDDFSANKNTHLLRKFLYYTQFYDAKVPLLLCEGKTDDIYIKYALMQLHSDYPELAEKTDKLKLKFRFYKESKKNSGHNLRVTGGTANISSIILEYKKISASFGEKTKTNPVIILIDNDKGAAPIFSTVKEITKQKVAGSEEFLHLFLNIYLVFTPKIQDKQSMIEDFFEESTKDIKFHGKSFSLEKNFDTKKFYGKSVFAHEVVIKQHLSINFEGFAPILQRIQKVIEYHKISN